MQAFYDSKILPRVWLKRLPSILSKVWKTRYNDLGGGNGGWIWYDDGPEEDAEFRKNKMRDRY